MIRHVLAFASCLAVAWSCSSLPAGGSTENLESGRLALQGYDPVSYFPEGGGAPKRGLESLALEHSEAWFRFSSAANRDLFVENPERYEPRYGGWCAWAMVEGDRVAIDPESFLIEEAGLYLFYDGLFGDTRKRWLAKGGATLRPLADRAWTNLLSNQTGEQ